MGDYYATLEVERTATLAEIKHSYRTLALKYHPDKAGEAGAAKFKEINEAYEVLSDPQKRSIYDQYGAAGLTAMDSPLGAFGATVAVVFTLVFVFISLSLLIIFMAFLGVYVDGHHLQSWNFVKVFIPIFVFDGLVGLPAALALTIARQFFAALTVVCAITLSVMIPIGKDRQNNYINHTGSHDIVWRVWMIPGYLLSVLAFLAYFQNRYPTATRTAQLEAEGQPLLAKHQGTPLILGLLKALCFVVFFALVACRADETLTTNYFVILGVPLFSFIFLTLVDEYVQQRDTLVRDPSTENLMQRKSPFCSAFCGLLLPCGMCCATIAMVCVRMNYVYHHHDSDGALDLTKALIPLFILVGFVILAVIVMGIFTFCAITLTAASPEENHPDDDRTTRDDAKAHTQNDEEKKAEAAPSAEAQHSDDGPTQGTTAAAAGGAPLSDVD